MSSLFLDRAGIGRLSIWKELIHLMLSNPLIGTGFGVSYETLILSNELGLGIHNIYLALLGEVGLIGFALFVSFLGSPVCACLRLLLVKSDRENGWVENSKYRIVCCIFGLLVAILIHQFFELGILRFNAMNFLWIAFLGQALAFCRLVPER